MVWTEIPLDGHTDLYAFHRGGIMAARHRSDILEPIARPHACAIGDAFILMQDNARAHTAHVAMTFIDDTGISVMAIHSRRIDNGRIIQRMYRTLSMPRFMHCRPYH